MLGLQINVGNRNAVCKNIKRATLFYCILLDCLVLHVCHNSASKIWISFSFPFMYIYASIEFCIVRFLMINRSKHITHIHNTCAAFYHKKSRVFIREKYSPFQSLAHSYFFVYSTQWHNNNKSLPQITTCYVCTKLPGTTIVL